MTTATLPSPRTIIRQQRAALEAERQAAYAIKRTILSNRTISFNDYPLIDFALGHIAIKSGMRAAQLLQAIADRVNWLERATYEAVMVIIHEEAEALDIKYF